MKSPNSQYALEGAQAFHKRLSELETRLQLVCPKAECAAELRERVGSQIGCARCGLIAGGFVERTKSVEEYQLTRSPIDSTNSGSKCLGGS